MNRHDLAVLSPNAQLNFIDKNLPVAVYFLIKAWVKQAIPMTICRQDAVASGQVKLAMSCFVNARKYRVAFTVDQKDICDIRHPVALHQIIQMFNVEQQHDLKFFLQHVEELGCQVYVYGSYANQYLTQQTYVTSKSDVDLVIYPAFYDMELIQSILKHIHDLKVKMGQPIDGEIRIHPQWHVSFNELQLAWQQQHTSVLVKGIEHIALLQLEQLWEQKDVKFSACSV